MKKLILTSVLSLFMVSCMAAGPAKTITRFEGMPITALDASSAFEVTISQGSTSSAKVTIPENYVDRLVFELENDGTLRVGMRQGLSRNKGEKLKLDVVCNTLTEVELSGAANARLVTGLTTNKLDIDLSGASIFRAAEAVVVNGECSIDCSGASVLEIMQFNAQATELDCSGASVVKIVGEATGVDYDLSGASSVDCSHLTTGVAECEVSGASSLMLFASELASGRASGASDVKVYGSGRLMIECTSSASVGRR
ncbi:MAG: DUF2807 domain-containing protein [Mucinivorans sp.]